jgi:preprotein translocase subunit SecA
LFEQTLDRIRTEVTRVLMNVEIQSAEQAAQSVPEAPRLADVQYQHADFDAQSAMALQDPESLALAAQSPGVGAGQTAEADAEAAAASPVRRAEPKVGRNDPCPCGSGKKFKQCHGKLG